MPSRSSELPPVMHYDVRYYRYCDHSTATHSVRYQMYCETPKKHTRAPSRSGSSHDIRCAALHRGQCEGLAHLQLFDKTQFFFLHISAKITSPWSRWSLMKQDFSRKLASSWLIGVLVDVTASLGCFVKEATVLETWRWCRAEHGGISGINSLLIFFFCLFFCDNKKIVIL